MANQIGSRAREDRLGKGQGSGISNLYENLEIIQGARHALLSRKRFSVRNQIYAAYLLVFLFAVAIAVVLITDIYQVEERLEFLEFANEFTSEVQQARRFEKNFFLYSTNIEDAIENINTAESIFALNADQFSEILGPSLQQSIYREINAYGQLLERLKNIKIQNPGIRPDNGEVEEIESELRVYGKSILSSAQGLIKMEKSALHETLNRSRMIHITSLIVLLLFLAVNAYLLVIRIYNTLKRFSTYAQRIAAGDFTPITPRRRYRDEFTELALAFNEMIKEIDNREAALIQVHKMRAVGTLTAGVAHELNNPLNNIMLTLHMLIEDYQELSDDERLEMLEEAVGETGRSRKIISNLLDFARESTSSMETIDLNKLLEDTIALVQNQIRFSGIKTELKIAEHLPHVHGDVQKLQQVLLNLILNAVDASSKGDTVQVLALPGDQPEFVKIKVIDYGSGIPPHIKSSIFDPFFTTKPKGKGTGLGLSVSQGIVAKHGGQILVSSEVNSGSTFTVILPVTTFPRDIPVL